MKKAGAAHRHVRKICTTILGAIEREGEKRRCV